MQMLRVQIFNINKVIIIVKNIIIVTIVIAIIIITVIINIIILFLFH